MAITATPVTSTAATASAVQTAVDKQMIASNFTSFLQLLTTQLKNQNPLDPLDTNQFTQQLVQFAQVEQQMKSNDQLTTLVSLEKNSQATTALAYVGSTVVVDGTNAELKAGSATWMVTVAKPAATTVTVKDSNGQVAFSGTYAMQPGGQEFVWDGRGNDGRVWPNGIYSISATAKDSNAQAVSLSTEVQGTVDSVDLTQTPALLAVSGQTFTLDRIKRIVRPGA